MVVERHGMPGFEQSRVATEDADTLPPAFGRSFGGGADYCVQAGAVTTTGYYANLRCHQAISV